MIRTTCLWSRPTWPWSCRPMKSCPSWRTPSANLRRRRSARFERPAGATVAAAAATVAAAAATVPPVDATFRPTVGDIRVPGPRRAARVFTSALLLAGCAAAAAFAWQSYGDAAERLIAQWPPQRILASLLPLEKPAASAQPTRPPPRRSRQTQCLRNRKLRPHRKGAPSAADPSVELGAIAARDGA